MHELIKVIRNIIFYAVWAIAILLYVFLKHFFPGLFVQP